MADDKYNQFCLKSLPRRQKKRRGKLDYPIIVGKFLEKIARIQKNFQKTFKICKIL